MIIIKNYFLGLAHIMLYKEKMNELKNNYSIKDSAMVEALNPKDKDFIYF